jgi:hypothetical protein
MLSDRQMDTVTAGDFTADATAQAFGAVTATSTLTSIFPSTLNGNPVTGSMSTASASSYSPP